jgi:hypothetical protein
MSSLGYEMPDKASIVVVSAANCIGLTLQFADKTQTTIPCPVT